MNPTRMRKYISAHQTLRTPSVIDWPVRQSDPDDMCPNCVTPWKCNGPHSPLVLAPR